MTTMNQLNAALHNCGIEGIAGRYYASARKAAKDAARMIGATYLGGNLVATDECICEVVVNRRHNMAWPREAACPNT